MLDTGNCFGIFTIEYKYNKWRKYGLYEEEKEKEKKKYLLKLKTFDITMPTYLS